MEWSQTHYNLIVYGNTDTPMFRSSSGWDSFPSERLLEATDGELRTKYDGNLEVDPISWTESGPS